MVLQDVTQLLGKNSLVSPSITTFFKEVAKMKQEGEVSPSSVNSFGSSLLASIPLPSNKEEAWRFTNLGKLFSSLPSGQNWISPTIPEEELLAILDPSAYHIFIIDGILRDDMCNFIDAELHVKWIGGDEDISNHMEKNKYFFLPEKNALPRESFGSDLLTALNMAATEGILHITVPKGVTISKPLQILCGSTVGTSNADSKGMFPKIVVDLGDDSSLQLKESHFSIMKGKFDGLDTKIDSNFSNFICSNVRCLLSNNATLQHSIFQDYSLSSRHCEVISTELMENSRYDLRILQAGSMQSRMNIHVNLTERCSNCTILGAALSSEYQVLDVHAAVFHSAQETVSKQKHHILAGEFGRAVYKGHVRIPEIGQKSDASQQCRSILLGKNVKVHMMPTLDIVANDVSCTHGATVADVDSDSVLFLKMRGVSYEVARQILTKSFILSTFDDVQLDDHLKKRILERIFQLSSKQTLDKNDQKSQK